MANQLICADLGTNCPGAFTTDTEDELWKHVELHAQEAHPDLELTPEFMEKAKGLVREA